MLCLLKSSSKACCSRRVAFRSVGSRSAVFTCSWSVCSCNRGDRESTGTEVRADCVTASTVLPLPAALSSAVKTPPSACSGRSCAGISIVVRAMTLLSRSACEGSEHPPAPHGVHSSVPSSYPSLQAQKVWSVAPMLAVEECCGQVTGTRPSGQYDPRGHSLHASPLSNVPGRHCTHVRVSEGAKSTPAKPVSHAHAAASGVSVAFAGQRSTAGSGSLTSIAREHAAPWHPVRPCTLDCTCASAAAPPPARSVPPSTRTSSVRSATVASAFASSKRRAAALLCEVCESALTTAAATSFTPAR